MFVVSDPSLDGVRKLIQHVEIVEVGPRDGLQNESRILSTEEKVDLVHRCISAGARRIEVASFVNPKKVPQMADAETVIENLTPNKDVTFIGLVLNMRGAQRALETNVHELGAVVVATDTFAIKNQGQTSEQSVDAAIEICGLATQANRQSNVTIAAAFGCPFEGEVSLDRVIHIAGRLVASGVKEIALADTIGVADPWRVGRAFEKLKILYPSISLRGHFHNTRNTGLANAYAAVLAGANTLDASLGGIGGCPFAPNATGNIPTEDLAYMLHRGGFGTNLKLASLLENAKWLSSVMGKSLPAMVSKAGDFPEPNIR